VFYREGEKVSNYSILSNNLRKCMEKDNNNARIEKVKSNLSPGLGENDNNIISTWNLGTIKLTRMMYE